MGGKASSYGDMFIELDDIKAVPDELVSGKIHINVNKRYSGSRLTLNLLGKEFTQWIEKLEPAHAGEASGRNQPKASRQQTKKMTQKKGTLVQDDTIINVIMPVYVWPHNCVEKGQYSIPFNFHLPPWIPNSFDYKKQADVASIKYTLEARIVASGIPPDEELQTVQNLTVHHRVDPALIKPIFVQESRRLKKWGFVKAGENSYRIRIKAYSRCIDFSS